MFKEIPDSRKTDVRVSRGIRYRSVPCQELENANLLRSFRCNLFTAGSLVRTWWLKRDAVYSCKASNSTFAIKLLARSTYLSYQQTEEKKHIKALCRAFRFDDREERKAR